MTIPWEEVCLRGLEEIFACGLEAATDPCCVSIDYRDLPGAVFDSILPHFGIRLDPEQTVWMREATRFDARMPAVFFEPDSDRKQKSGSPDLRRLCHASLNPIYQELQNLSA